MSFSRENIYVPYGWLPGPLVINPYTGGMAGPGYTQSSVKVLPTFHTYPVTDEGGFGYVTMHQIVLMLPDAIGPDSSLSHFLEPTVDLSPPPPQFIDYA